MGMPLNDHNERTIIMDGNTTLVLEAGFEITKVRFVIQDKDSNILFDIDIQQHRLFRLARACMDAANFAAGRL
jgi:hypothetical protein